MINVKNRNYYFNFHHYAINAISHIITYKINAYLLLYHLSYKQCS